MEIQDRNSQETIEFIEKLEKLAEMIKTAFSQRTPQLNGEKYLTNKDMEKFLQISKRTLQEYRDSGRIGFIQISGKILYRESDVLKLLEENYVSGY